MRDNKIKSFKRKLLPQTLSWRDGWGPPIQEPYLPGAEAKQALEDPMPPHTRSCGTFPTMSPAD